MKAVDIFCGVGGLSKGLQDAGIDLVAAYDNWPIAVNTYTQNMHHGASLLDLLDVQKASKIIASHKSEIIVGGPPCQDFSTAGRRIEGGKADLTIAYASIVAACKPPLALMENVPQVRLSKTYRKAIWILQKAGYQIIENVLDASYCGVPQIRKRFFMIATREPCLGRLLPWIEENKSKKRLTVKSYLKNTIKIDYYYRHPRNYSRRAIFSVWEPSPTIRSVNRPVPPNYVGNHLDSTQPENVRALTHHERSRIQTFPRSWQWPGELTKGEAELLVGNAVPVNLAKFIGKGLLYATSQ